MLKHPSLSLLFILAITPPANQTNNSSPTSQCFDISDHLPSLRDDVYARPRFAVTVENSGVEGNGRVVASDEYEYIRDPYGSAYWCQLPDLPVHPNPLSTSRQELAAYGQDLLGWLSGCVKKTFAWWSYEICFRNYVRQYHEHKELDYLEEYYLGYHDSPSDQVRTVFGSDQKHVMVETYNRGTTCDLTHRPRKAQIRYSCDPNVAKVEVDGVREVQTCEYVIQVRASVLCLGAAFVREGEKEDARRVKCFREDDAKGRDVSDLVALDRSSRLALGLAPRLPPDHALRQAGYELGHVLWESRRKQEAKKEQVTVERASKEAGVESEADPRGSSTLRFV